MLYVYILLAYPCPFGCIFELQRWYYVLEHI